MLSVALTVRRALCVAVALTLVFATTGCQQWLAAGAREPGHEQSPPARMPAITSTDATPEPVRPFTNGTRATIPVAPVVEYFLAPTTLVGVSVELGGDDYGPFEISPFDFPRQHVFLSVEGWVLVDAGVPGSYRLQISSPSIYDYSADFPDSAEPFVLVKIVATPRRDNNYGGPPAALVNPGSNPPPLEFTLQLAFWDSFDVVDASNIPGEPDQMRLVKYVENPGLWALVHGDLPELESVYYPLGSFVTGHGTPGAVAWEFLSGQYPPNVDGGLVDSDDGDAVWGLYCNTDIGH